jgi:hypothetical protein
MFPCNGSANLPKVEREARYENVTKTMIYNKAQTADKQSSCDLLDDAPVSTSVLSPLASPQSVICCMESTWLQRSRVVSGAHLGT